MSGASGLSSCSTQCVPKGFRCASHISVVSLKYLSPITMELTESTGPEGDWGQDTGQM